MLGYEITKSASIDSLRDKLNNVTNEVTALRAQFDFGIPLANASNISMEPYVVAFPRMYDLAAASSLMQTITSAITNETFRNGWEFEKTFEKKCLDCGMEYDYECHECDNCGSTKLREPDYDQIRNLNQFLEGEVNSNGQTLSSLLKQVEYDHLIVDNAYVQAVKTYLVSEEGEIVGAKINEVVRVHPAHVTILHDSKGRLGFNQSGDELKFCVFHRDNLVSDDSTHCRQCGTELIPAHYELNQGADKSKSYYAPDEIKHTSEFKPTLILAEPIFLSVWQEVELLLNMTSYNRKSFGEERTPNKLLIVNSTSTSALERMITWMRDQMKRYPNMLIPFGIDQRDTSGAPAQVLNLVDKELLESNVALVQETRKHVGAVYGVAPVFLSDVSTSGGLNNEGLQVTVTNRAVERSQSPFNNDLFPWLLKQYGVTDYRLKLNPSEEKDEAAEEQLEVLKAQRAQLMLGMGFDVSLDEQGEFAYSGEARQIAANAFTPTLDFSGFSDIEPTGSPLELRADAIKKKKFTEDEFERELEKLFKETKLSEAKSLSEVKRRGKRLAEQLAKRLRVTSKELVKRVYEQAVEEVEKDLNLNIPFEAKDQAVIEELQLNPEMTEAFERVKDYLNEHTLDAVKRGYERGASIPKIARELKEVVSGTEKQLQMVARTEAQNVNTRARLVSYSKFDDGSFKYKWVNPLDSRTTKHCKRIVERTRNGVPMNELQRIIREEAADTFLESRPFSPHIGCRSNFVRVGAL